MITGNSGATSTTPMSAAFSACSLICRSTRSTGSKPARVPRSIAPRRFSATEADDLMPRRRGGQSRRRDRAPGLCRRRHRRRSPDSSGRSRDARRWRSDYQLAQSSRPRRQSRRSATLGARQRRSGQRRNDHRRDEKARSRRSQRRRRDQALRRQEAPRLGQAGLISRLSAERRASRCPGWACRHRTGTGRAGNRAPAHSAD